ncbi:MAG TPA: 2-oxoglutarate dehydrogenase E1 component [Myxococcota bacterium]|nr:2-oxoglutarate dehydrogenase E1 component [Myxococcota bacterium]
MSATGRAERVIELYRAWRSQPDAVDASWRDFFGALDDGARTHLERLAGGASPAARAPAAASASATDVRRAGLDSIRAMALIDAYRTRGHLAARLDPLGLKPIASNPELEPSTYGFAEADLDRPIFLGGELGFEEASLREIVASLRRVYCGIVGIEYMHIQDPAQRKWIQERVEGIQHQVVLKREGKIEILDHLTAAETFERFIHRKWVGTKRFGLDGADSAIPALEQIVRRAAELGVEEIAIGMPHRGRLNVLANVMLKPYRTIFAEFSGSTAAYDDYGSGDVKYHMGTSTDRVVRDRKVHLSLTANPSHLEAVDPVVLGKVRAKQDLRDDKTRRSVMGLLLHGDAAFAGQGLVAETLMLSELAGYDTGGTFHLIINNQIGFTTDPTSARSGPYCSDVGQMVQLPIVHVNGDYPEAVVAVVGFATEFLLRFGKDVIVDLFCYRRYGHNEADEPMFTQPLMYRRIAEHQTVREGYARHLREEGTIAAGEADALVENWQKRLEKEFELSKQQSANRADWLEGTWSGLEPVKGYDARRGKTAVDLDTLREVGRAITRIPENFAAHRKLQKLFEAKAQAIESGEGIDWATAEALAFGTLLIEGQPVRLSGQDSERGTFSQRHAAIFDQNDGRRYVPLDHIREHQERLEVLNSPLAELSVLGFEYGYSLADPRTLVLWEAQFGDFANGAQVVIDQFLVAAEYKWLRMSGIVLLLPHGYEGQGPEHSSARLERFLQMCAQDNIQVVNVTTPANYFHVLRRQMHRSFRKPLVVMTPKSLLRHKRCVSRLADLGPGTGFHRVMYDDVLPSEPEESRQLVLCSGKVYYDLLAEREARGANDVHLLRCEQLYPFPADALAELLEPYRHCHLVWCQEEPRNMGAWEYIEDLIREVAVEAGCKHPEPRYAGRPTSAATATGLLDRHESERAELLDDALTVGKQGMARLAYRRAKAAKATKSAKAAH